MATLCTIGQGGIAAASSRVQYGLKAMLVPEVLAASSMCALLEWKGRSRSCSCSGTLPCTPRTRAAASGSIALQLLNTTSVLDPWLRNTLSHNTHHAREAAVSLLPSLRVCNVRMWTCACCMQHLCTFESVEGFHLHAGARLGACANGILEELVHVVKHHGRILAAAPCILRTQEHTTSQHKA